MNGYLKQSTAAQVRTIGPFVDDTDFKTLKNALTIANTDVVIKKNGAASSSKNSGGATADGSGGLYHLTWDATDSATVGELRGSVKVAGALVYFFTYVVVEEAIYDMLFGASAIGYIVDQPVNATKIGGTTQTGRDIGASVLLSAGTGAGQIDFTSGVVKANLAQILGTALTETAGQIAAAFKKFFNIATPAATMDHLILVDTVTTYTGNTPQTGDNYPRIGAPAGASVSADVAAVKTDTGNLITRIPAALFANITSLAQWLGLIAGKQVGNSTARTEVRATGAGSGTFDETTDSQEALRDRGDSAWITGTAPDNSGIAAIKVKTDQLVFTVANQLDVNTLALAASVATQITDALLKRDMSAVSGEASRSPLNALRFLRNKWDLAGGTLTVKKEDDSATAWTAAVTTNAAADPVTGSDPA